MKAKVFASPAVWATSLLLVGCLMSRLSVDENAVEAGAGDDASGGTKPKAGASNGGVGANDSGGTSQGPGGNDGSGGTDTGGKPSGGTGGKPSGGTDQGGTATGGTAQSGSANEGGGGAGPVEPCSDPVSCIDEVAGNASDFGNPGWKDSWWVIGCKSKNTWECLTTEGSCNVTGTTEEVGSRTLETWQLGGEKGQHYKVTFQFNGIVEGKGYQNGTADAALPASNIAYDQTYDMFYRDGQSMVTNYEALKLTVYDDAGAEARHYYMNAGNGTNWEQHATFLASYTKSIVVIGQGKIVHMVQDKNCRSVDNCGSGIIDGPTCNAPRRLPGNDANLMLPPKYRDASDGTIKDTQLLASGLAGATRAQPWRAHASHLKITAIEKTSDPVTKNY